MIFFIIGTSFPGENLKKLLSSNEKSYCDFKNNQSCSSKSIKYISKNKENDPKVDNDFIYGIYSNLYKRIPDYDEYSNFSLIIRPFPQKMGPGLRASFIRSKKSGYGESIFYIQSSVNIPANFMAFVLGMNVISILEGEGPEGLLLPSLEIRAGNLNKFYISGSILSDLFFGWVSLNLNYRFNDKISSIMVGRAIGFDQENAGYIYEIDYNIWKKMILCFRGYLNFSEKSYVTQIGVGVAL